MISTKERILKTSLSLFSKDGYEAVSVSQIADSLGITKGALYKHFKNKRDIFDSIVNRMIALDAERSKEFNMPEDRFESSPASYKKVSVEAIRNFTMAQFSFWTEDEFASEFRKMLTLEQYRNPEMAKLYQSCIAAGPLSYMEDIFHEMIQQGALKGADPKQLALQYYAPFYLLITISDSSAEKKAIWEQLEMHIHSFFRQHISE